MIHTTWDEFAEYIKQIAKEQAEQSKIKLSVWAKHRNKYCRLAKCYRRGKRPKKVFITKIGQ